MYTQLSVVPKGLGFLPEAEDNLVFLLKQESEWI